MYGTDRRSMRTVFFEAWRKHRSGAALEPLERMVADVIERHPEYHRLLETGDEALDRDYTPEQGQTNPFLHMGFHITIREQIAIDRPVGVTALYRRLCIALGDEHEAEHRMLDCLGRALWEVQRHGQAFNDDDYLACLKRLL